MKEIFIPAYPCMYDPRKECVECNALAGNIENLRKTIRERSIIYYFNKEGIDKPTVQNMCDLLFNLDNPMGMIYSDALERNILISRDLKKLGRELAYWRRESIIKISNIPELQTRCPNIK